MPVQNQLLDGKAMADAAKLNITQINYAEFENQRENALVIDVREPNEFSAGSVPNAVSIPRGLLEFKIGKVASDYASQTNSEAAAVPIFVYCRSGSRSALAADTLRRMGYTKVSSLNGGYKTWSTQEK